MSIVYGPVPSWRLGRSLGVDLTPGDVKTCSFDCIYCQLGWTARPLVERAQFVSLEALGGELEAAHDVGADYVTFSGMGEPTLAANLGEAIRVARATLGLPVAVLTNSSLMTRKDVREDLACASVVVAKLDAPDERLFRLTNRPVGDLSLEEIVDGIKRFRSEWSGTLALQMMFLTTNKRAAEEMAALAATLSPDEVQVNTPLRPSAAAPLSRQEIGAICQSFKGLPVRSVYEAVPLAVTPVDMEATLRRRPGSLGRGGSFP